MRTRLAVAVLLVACSSRPGPRRSPLGGAPVGWTWTGSTDPAWRLPAPATAAGVLAGDRTAVVMVGPRTAVAVELATGAVGEPYELVPAPATVAALARVGDRLIAFGSDRDGAAVWDVAGEPPAARALAVPATTGARAAGPTSDAVAVSTDGRAVFVCSEDHAPVLRDGATLAPVHEYPDLGAACFDPVFADAASIALGLPDLVDVTGARLPVVRLDLATGAAREVPPGDALTIAGPAGTTLAIRDGAWTFADRSGRMIGRVDGYRAPRWLADGTAVVTTGLGLTFQPPTADRRRTDVPSQARGVAVGDHRVVTFDGYFVATVDPDNRDHRHATGNARAVTLVAPRGDGVVAFASELAAWTAGERVRTFDGHPVAVAAEPADAPIAVLERLHLTAWDPDGCAACAPRELGGGSAIARRGERMVWGNTGNVYRAERGGAPSRWFRFRPDLDLVAIDLVGERFAWFDRERGARGAYRVAALADRRAFTVCVAARGRIALEPGTSRLGIDDGATIRLYDSAAQRALGGARLGDRAIGGWAFVPGTGEVALGVGADVILWRPGAGTATSWSTGRAAPITALGVDAQGRALAIGHADGAVRWMELAGLRARAVPVAVIAEPPETAAVADTISAGGAAGCGADGGADAIELELAP